MQGFSSLTLRRRQSRILLSLLRAARLYLVPLLARRLLLSPYHTFCHSTRFSICLNAYLPSCLPAHIYLDIHIHTSFASSFSLSLSSLALPIPLCLGLCLCLCLCLSFLPYVLHAPVQCSTSQAFQTVELQEDAGTQHGKQCAALTETGKPGQKTLASHQIACPTFTSGSVTAFMHEGLPLCLRMKTASRAGRAVVERHTQ